MNHIFLFLILMAFLILSSLILSSSCGIDNIISKFLRNMSSVRLVFVENIAAALRYGHVTWRWECHPVHKGREKTSPLNYQPISLTSVPSKILEHVIYKCLVSCLDSNLSVTFNTVLVRISHVKCNLFLLIIYSKTMNLVIPLMQFFRLSWKLSTKFLITICSSNCLPYILIHLSFHGSHLFSLTITSSSTSITLFPSFLP